MQCKPLLDFIKPEYRAAFRALHERVMRGENGSLEFEVIGLKGGIRWLETHATPVRDAGGQIQSLLGITRDITGRKQTEAALCASEARYRQLFAASPDALFVLDRTGRFLDCNEAAAQRYGYSRAELLQMSAQDLAAPDLREHAATRIKEALATGGAFEWRHRRKDGSELPVENRAKPFEMGGQTLILSSVRDITVRKRAELALCESEARLRLVLDGLGTQMFVGLLDTAGVVLVANRPALEAAGLRVEDVLGQPVHETYWFTYSDAVAQRFRAAVQRATQGETMRYDEQIRVAEGRLIWVAFTLNPLRDESGKIVFLVPSAVVIEERKQAEAALRASHDRLKKVLAVEMVGVMFWDLASGCMTDANDTFLTIMGYSRADVEARALTWQKLTPPEYLEASRAEIRKFQATGRVGPYEKEYLRKDGTRQWFVFAGSSLGPDTCVEFCVDISERKQAESALLASRAQLQVLSRQLISAQEDERRHIARELHDEIGQVLTAVSINLHAVKGSPGAAGSERIDESIGIVNQAIQQVRNMSLDLRPTILDDFGLTAALRWYLDRQAQRTGLAVHLDSQVADARLPVELESTCFRVTQEAMTNIVRHSKAKEVWVALRQSDGKLELNIRDNGAGFDVERARARAASGGCAGLLGMQERVELLGGRFTIESTLGQGAVIGVVLNMGELPGEPKDEDHSRSAR